jgi:glycosyltransferase involved in cell wall biosynthesis
MEFPLVSVICLSYNHEKFVKEAVQSILNQSYPNIELILVDDASTDASPQIVKQIAEGNPKIKILLLQENVGNCKAFNKGLTLSKGDFVIDLAADDVLLEERIEVGVKAFLNNSEEHGVHFTDADWVNEQGDHLYFHSDKFPHSTIPQGDIYENIISRYFICPASVLFRREVMNSLGGYDETLSYEDFDILVRSSRKYKFAYSPDVLVKKRITSNAMSKKQFELFNSYSASTFKICEKIMNLNKDKEEKKALNKRIGYEIRLNLRLLNFGIVVKYLFLWIRNKQLHYLN